MEHLRRRLYVIWGRVPGQSHPRHPCNRRRSLMGSREGHDQAERAITGPSRRFLVLFAESKSTAPRRPQGREIVPAGDEVACGRRGDGAALRGRGRSFHRRKEPKAAGARDPKCRTPPGRAGECPTGDKHDQRSRPGVPLCAFGALTTHQVSLSTNVRRSPKTCGIPPPQVICDLRGALDKAIHGSSQP